MAGFIYEITFEANICRNNNLDKPPHLWSAIFFLSLKTHNLSNVKLNTAVIPVPINQVRILLCWNLELTINITNKVIKPPRK